eukprot:GHVP01041290.1.p1 GENE.GHVP01041290.1~~GHVP01041290.1.p1  ORF type:complete len:366 (-),score=87.28 GHVP01041290.1:34-1053(-)
MKSYSRKFENYWSHKPDPNSENRDPGRENRDLGREISEPLLVDQHDRRSKRSEISDLDGEVLQSVAAAQRQISSLRRALTRSNDELQSFQYNEAKKLDEIQNFHANQMKEVLCRFEETLETVELRHEREKSDLIDKHRTEFQEANNQYYKDLMRIRSERNEEMDENRRKRKEDVRNFQEKVEHQVKNLIDRFDEERRDAESEFMSVISRMKEDSEKERNENLSVINQLTDRNVELDAANRCLQRKIEQIKNEKAKQETEIENMRKKQDEDQLVIKHLKEKDLVKKSTTEVCGTQTFYETALRKKPKELNPLEKVKTYQKIGLLMTSISNVDCIAEKFLS